MPKLEKGTYNFITVSQKENFFYNIKHHKDILDDLQLSTETSVVYNINSMGFRSDYEFVSNEPCNVYLGCSYTLGEEVQLSNCWASLVNLYCNDYKMYNMGSLGASNVTCYRILKDASNMFDIKRVFILKPYNNRKEIFYDNKWITFSIQRNTIFKNNKNLLPFFDDNLCMLEKEMALDGIRHICNTLNIKLYELDTEDPVIREKINSDRTARDLLHFGKNTHKFIANNFIKQLKKND